MNILVLPVATPLLAAILLLWTPTPRMRRSLSTFMAALTFLICLAIALPSFQGEVLVAQMGGWAAPFGISLVADGLTGLMLLGSSLLGLLTTISLGSSLNYPAKRGQTALLNKTREALGVHPLLQLLFMGVNMSFLTGDLFNLFVSFEVMLIASYGLMVIGGELPQLREGLKYVIVNLIVSALFVVAAGLTYGLAGTLNYADIAQKLAGQGGDPRVLALTALLALVFATKGALFPFGFWLPYSYPVVPGAVAAFFAALLTKVGVYALLRVFYLLNPAPSLLLGILLLLAGLSMLFGCFGALAQGRWRHLLAFANIASVGYLIAGLSVGALAPTLYYLLTSVVVIFTLFLIADLAHMVGGERFSDHSGGHLAHYPFLGALFFFAALTLAGLPPTSGFIGKFALIQQLASQSSAPVIFVIAVMLVAGLLLLYAMVKIWRAFFWGESDAVHRVNLPPTMLGVTVAASLLLVSLTVFAGPLYALSDTISQQLKSPERYIQSVLQPKDTP